MEPACRGPSQSRGPPLLPFTPAPAMKPPDRTPPADLMSLLKVAAESRAMGNPWPAVAKRVGRDERTVRRWKEHYPRVWRRLFRQAEDDLFNQVAGMAVTVMSNL